MFSCYVVDNDGAVTVVGVIAPAEYTAEWAADHSELCPKYGISGHRLISFIHKKWLCPLPTLYKYSGP